MRAESNEAEMKKNAFLGRDVNLKKEGKERNENDIEGVFVGLVTGKKRCRNIQKKEENARH